MPDTTKACGICRQPLSTDPTSSARDCGGDCLRCMAEAGDPDAIAGMAALPKPERPYAAFYRGKRIFVFAPTSYAAQQQAAKRLKAKKEWQVDVYLADQPVDPAMLPGS